MPKAKITSKGQVTIPAEVRAALGLKQGDMLAFETSADYVVVRRLPTASEIADKYAYLFEGTHRSFASDDEAVAAYFRHQEPDDLAAEPMLARRRRSRGTDNS